MVDVEPRCANCNHLWSDHGDRAIQVCAGNGDMNRPHSCRCPGYEAQLAGVVR